VSSAVTLGPHKRDSWPS